MNKKLLSCLAMCLFSISVLAQNTIQLNINHKLGEEDFALNQAAENNLGNYFEVTRLEYYISKITIIHDGGLETDLDGVYLLVDASETTEVELGSYDITEVESIHYYIGVDPDANHSDPAAYESDHPLAPQFPSMHWGWTSGYRFTAFEGKGGSPSNQQTIELHSLGDNNYFLSTMEIAASAENNVVVLNLDADYAKVLNVIDVSSGVIVHGDGGAAKQSVSNFKTVVFSPSPIELNAPAVTIGTGTEYEGGIYEVTAVSDNDEDVFQWVLTDDNGNQITVVDGPEFNYDFEFNGTHTLTLTVTNSTGQTTTKTQEVNINSANAVGIEELTNISAVELYPVPATNVVNLKLTLKDAQKMNITIRNLLGQTVATVNQNDFSQGENLIKISTVDFVNGLYFLNVEADGQLTTQRFVVNK